MRERIRPIKPLGTQRMIQKHKICRRQNETEVENIKQVYKNQKA